ncbi:dephospho-CoA kinase [Anaerosporobacter sp.]|uniref:dephospho-CoA kinase n=1 Tax=Anaerosporobacter sp. TaxID=1872529 RepID=UPI00286FA2E0|nr:dephospho-CoA kinase [Anaerosporobacter sp.]
MKVIGLMGGVGSGKSTVANILEKEYGAYLIITDDIAKKLYDKDEEGYQKVVSYFGTEILNEDGQINRKQLSGIVFADKDKLEKLNSFIHPLVMKYVINEIENIKKENKQKTKEEQVPYIVIETALLIEAGYRGLCDTVWYVAVNEEVRKQRLMSGRGYSEEKIASILKNQMSDADYSDNCDKILYNNGDVDTLRKEIQFLLV